MFVDIKLVTWKRAETVIFISDTSRHWKNVFQKQACLYWDELYWFCSSLRNKRFFQAHCINTKLDTRRNLHSLFCPLNQKIWTPNSYVVVFSVSIGKRFLHFRSNQLILSDQIITLQGDFVLEIKDESPIKY